jgi:hypothetical protein
VSLVRFSAQSSVDFGFVALVFAIRLENKNGIRAILHPKIKNKTLPLLPVQLASKDLIPKR